MGFVLLVAFIGVPLIEIGLFIEVGDILGLWPTIGVVILTAMAGTVLLRHQGLSTLAKLQSSLDRGEMPLETVFDGFCLMAAGLLLLTPGFFTDGIGFLLFTPPFRALCAAPLPTGCRSTAPISPMAKPKPTIPPTPARPDGAMVPAGPGTSARPDDIIDGEFTDITDHEDSAKLDHDPDPKL